MLYKLIHIYIYIYIYIYIFVYLFTSVDPPDTAAEFSDSCCMLDLHACKKIWTPILSVTPPQVFFTRSCILCQNELRRSKCCSGAAGQVGLYSSGAAGMVDVSS